MAKRSTALFASPFAFVGLVIFMAMVGAGTTYAALNTYEVISENDLPYISTIKGVSLTHDATKEQTLIDAYNKHIQPGSFGIPEKIRLPESAKHISLKSAIRQNDAFNANSNWGHAFITEPQRQKMFGEAVIYMRTDSPTMHNIGQVLTGDSFNIVTDNGWQLGFTVYASSTAYDQTLAKRKKTVPSITLIILGDSDTRYYYAELTKVGERL